MKPHRKEKEGRRKMRRWFGMLQFSRKNPLQTPLINLQVFPDFLHYLTTYFAVNDIDAG